MGRSEATTVLAVDLGAESGRVMAVEAGTYEPRDAEAWDAAFARLADVSREGSLR